MDQTILPNDLQMILNDTGQGIDDTTHMVPIWAEYMAALLECLEFYAMANDSQHPEQYELMLTRLQDQIGTRLRTGNW
jgi:hypothetical protein